MSFPQWRGIFVHRFLEYCQRKSYAEALAYVRTKRLRGLRELCEKIDVGALPEGRTELGLAYSPLTGTGRETRRHVWDVDAVTEHYIRLDLVADRDGSPHVVDYKTGDVRGLDPWQEPQLLGGMVALRATLQADPMGIVSGPPPNGRYFASFAGIEGDGAVRWRTACYDEETLDAFAERSRQIHLQVLDNRRRLDHGEQLRFQTGPACADCALEPLCPERAREKLQAPALDAARDGSG